MEFLEIPLFDDDIFKLLVRFAINSLFLSLIVAFAIYPRQREREFAFTAVMLNVIVFFICFTMKKLELDLGLALGLFAVFGVLRYRTDAIRVKEMTYLFIVIGIGVINSLSNKQTSYAEILLVNSVIFSVALLKEWIVGCPPLTTDQHNASAIDKLDSDRDENPEKRKGNGKRKKCDEATKLPKYSFEYDRLNLLGEAHRPSLIADLQERTGMDIVKVEVKSVDLVQNKANLTIWTSAPSADSSEPSKSE
ncbi:MAG: DUF4956 domain-containing protein [Planctomycetales bacterium]|nr:DUF4956 domain-containing protein [Planctomycetales bacterium]